MEKKYKKIPFSWVVILFSATNLFAQAPDTLWTKTYGGGNSDVGHSVQQTSDGGYIITGYTESFGAGGPDVYLLKTDSLGDTLWTKTYGGGNNDVGYSVQQTSDGGYIVTARTYSFGAGGSDVYLLKTDSLGDTLWTETYGGTDSDGGYSVQQTPDLGYIIAGYTKSFGAGNYDVYLIKMESDVGIKENQITKTNPPLANLEVFPNPFKEQTNIKYSIGHSAEGMGLEIYNCAGQLIRQFDYETIRLSDHIIWDGRDNSGEKVSNGVYILSFSAGKFNVTRKLIMMRR